MTARQLITALQSLGEENLDREICIFDGQWPSWYTPYKVEVLDDDKWKILKGKILID